MRIFRTRQGRPIGKSPTQGNTFFGFVSMLNHVATPVFGVHAKLLPTYTIERGFSFIDFFDAHSLNAYKQTK